MFFGAVKGGGMSSRHHIGAVLGTCMVLCAPVAAAQTPNEKCVNPAEAEQQVLALDEKRVSALRDNDVAFLDAITDEDYLHVHSSGNARSKAQFMRGRANRTSSFSAFVIVENRATIYCNVAIVAGTYHNSQKGSTAEKHARHLRIYVHRDGQWKNVVHQSTRVGGSD
ncbi:nuclear transport factor 2 family protein [Rhizobium leguminosarum]|uniref:nuclear transport factor 2 family protein n=1 Tax=Rhizobium leguminosarum TaxID=384 RepID=UPI001C9382F4|nr:nuclear transport factor 2 family protein [Rhizobium leguminosarum]MBY5775016.1 nuclear transport factor 2 family protein [Rhizobium leguminosarum]